MEKHKVLLLPQPFADGFVRGSYDIFIGKRTAFRGDVVVCSTSVPLYRGYESGVTLALAELYDCKPLAELTEEEWYKTAIPKKRRAKIKQNQANCFASFFRNVRRVIEMPIRTKNRGLCSVDLEDDMIIEYPNIVQYDL
jgi:hypothetical protein